MDDGIEKIEDDSLVQQLKNQAKVVYRKATILTILLVLIYMVIPV